MKSLFISIICLAISSAAFSQTHNGIVASNNPFYQLPAIQLPNISTYKAFTLNNVSTFSIYNEVTGFNDTFNSTKSSYYYSTHSYIHANTYRGVKVDSFNPHGAHDLGNAVVSGVFSLLF